MAGKDTTKNELAVKLSRIEEARAAMKKHLGVENLAKLALSSEGWVKGGHLGDMAVICGVVESAKLFEVDDAKAKKTKHAVGYSVRLSAPLPYEKAIGDTENGVNYKEGDVVLLGERAQLKALRNLPQGTFILLTVKDRIDVGQPSPMIRFECEFSPPASPAAQQNTLRMAIADSWEAIKNGAQSGLVDPWDVETE